MPPLSEDPRIEAVARAICRARNQDPDAEIETGNVEPVVYRDIVTTGAERAPAWLKFIQEAREFVAAHDALRITR